MLYRVKATYKYVREDADELSFDVGEIINVVEYDDPEDQVGNFHYDSRLKFVACDSCNRNLFCDKKKM